MFDLLWGLISENSLCILELIIADIFRLVFINLFCEWIIDYLCTIVYCSSLGYALPRIIMKLTLFFRWDLQMQSTLQEPLLPGQ